MRRIFFLIPNDSMTNGGAEEIMRLTACFFLERGDEVHIFFLTEKRYGDWEDLNFSNLRLHYSCIKGKLGVFSILWNIFNVRHVEFDYSFSSIVLCSGIVGILRRLRVLHIKKVIARESTMVFRRSQGKLLKRELFMYKHGYSAIDTIICQTQTMKDDLVRYLPSLSVRSKIIVAPNPIDIDKIHRLEKAYVDVSQLKPYIVAAGRLHPVKGYDILVKAFAEVKKNYKNIKLLILGEGKERANLTKQIKELNLQEDVFMPGVTSNVYPYFKYAEVCVVSSIVEGFPNVLLQMMSQNDKVVSTTCSGGIDEIQGLVTSEPGNEMSLAAAIETCLLSDSSQNRTSFDNELKRRNVESFVGTIIA